MQFVWKYIDDMVGKGLELTVIFKLLIYVAASLVPMALPLAILLSSLMTFGNLGENYELVAFKSAGVSLKRILRPLTVVAVLLSILAFLFSNYWLPVANLKSKSLLYDVKQQKPTMDIKPGIFSSDLDDFTIRVQNKKDIDGVEHLYDIMIYNHSDGKGNRSVIAAEEGIMTVTPDKKFIEFRLFNGINYDEEEEGRSNRKYPMSKTKFSENLIRFDLSEFALNRTDEDAFKNGYKMLNLKQLGESIDTLNKYMKGNLKNFQLGFRKSYYLYSDNKNENKTHHVINGPYDINTFFNQLSDIQKEQLLITSANVSRNAKSRISSMQSDYKSRSKYIRNHEVEWHKKLTLSFACLILFFIGAPLGAIIRKGGLGMPIVISVVFFLVFHILSITGEKMALEGAIPVANGMWMASFILMPIGIFFTIKATSDSALFNTESYTNFFKKIFPSKSKTKAK
jgi:lipopolysaccharide export system permease protein